MNDAHLRTFVLLVAAIHAYDRDDRPVECADCGASWYGAPTDPCDWCARRATALATDILRPPRPRGYGYATPEDLANLGYDRDAERRADLEQWRHHLDIAVEAELISEEQGATAWQSASESSNTSTGRTSMLALITTKQSSPDSPTVAGGRPSPRRRKPGNRRSC